MTIKHTPGPWEFRQRSLPKGGIKNEIHQIKKPDKGSWEIAEVVFPSDAKLIAAAPDMAEALSAMLTYSRFIGLGSAEGYNDAIKKALAALAKAGVE